MINNNARAEITKNTIRYLNAQTDGLDKISDKFKIKFSGNHEQTLEKIDSETLADLHKYLATESYIGLFQSHKAINILNETERFTLLSFYINECKQASKSSSGITALLLLRLTTEIIITTQGNKNVALAKGIEIFTERLKTDVDLNALKEKEKEITTFLQDIKDLGADLLQLNLQKVQEFLENYNLADMLKLMCIIFENSTLKDEIKRQEEEEKRGIIQAITFKKNATADKKTSVTANEEKAKTSETKTENKADAIETETKESKNSSPTLGDLISSSPSSKKEDDNKEKPSQEADQSFQIPF